MLLYVYDADLLSMSTSHTAVVPVGSFSIRELKIFRSCSTSALPAGTAAAAAVFGPEAVPEFLDSVYNAAPTATAAITTKIPTTILFEPDAFGSCAASNISPSLYPQPCSRSTAFRIKVISFRTLETPATPACERRGFSEWKRRVGSPS